MRICDKCGGVVYRVVGVNGNEQIFDLCKKHYDEVIEYLSTRVAPTEDNPAPVFGTVTGNGAIENVNVVVPKNGEVKKDRAPARKSRARVKKKN